MAKLRPLANNLLIKRADPDEKTPGGLYIPDKAQNKPHRGTVRAAGPGYVNDHGAFIETTCKVGDVVLYGAGLGVDVNIDGEALVMLAEDGVLGILEA